MAKQIIVLDVTKGPGGDRDVKYLFWLYPAAGREIPKPDATSLFVTRGAIPGANAGEITAIQAGTIVEEVYSTQFPIAYTQAQIKSALEAKYAERAAAFAALLNPNQFYGLSWDGATWA